MYALPRNHTPLLFIVWKSDKPKKKQFLCHWYYPTHSALRNVRVFPFEVETIWNVKCGPTNAHCKNLSCKQSLCVQDMKNIACSAKTLIECNHLVVGGGGGIKFLFRLFRCNFGKFLVTCALNPKKCQLH